MNTNTNGFGVNVWWTLPETSVDGEKAQTLLAKHGFDPSDLRVPSRQIQVSRAAYSFQNRRGKTNRRVTERAVDTGKTVTYGILDREQEGDSVSFAQHTTVRLSKESGQVTVQGNLHEAYMQALQEFQGKVTDADLRYFLRRVIRMSFGVAKRPTGGIYFVPEKFVGVIRQAQALLAEFNTNARIYVEEVTNNVESRQNIWESVEADVSDRVTEAMAALGRIENRVSAVKGQGDKISEADELMQVYKQLLGEEAKFESIAEKIEEAVRAVNEKMSEMQSARPVKVVTVKTDRVKTGVTVIDAAVKVLTQAGKPLSYRDIVDIAVTDGLYSSGSAHQYSSFNGTLLKAIKDGDKRVERMGRGVYQIAG